MKPEPHRTQRFTHRLVLTGVPVCRGTSLGPHPIWTFRMRRARASPSRRHFKRTISSQCLVYHRDMGGTERSGASIQKGGGGRIEGRKRRTRPNCTATPRLDCLMGGPLHTETRRGLIHSRLWFTAQVLLCRSAVPCTLCEGHGKHKAAWLCEHWKPKSLCVGSPLRLSNESAAMDKCSLVCVLLKIGCVQTREAAPSLERPRERVLPHTPRSLKLLQTWFL